MRSSLAVLSVLIATLLAIVAFELGSSTLYATHPHSPPRLVYGLHPNPGGLASYSLCTSDPATSWFWAWGPEQWEVATEDAMNFYLSSTNCNINTTWQNQWEGYYICPNPTWVACHIVTSSATHNDHTNLYKAKIVYDGSLWPNLTDDQKRASSSHEMGHGVGLRDHSNGACAALTIMGQLDNPPCYQSPTFWDAIAAMDTHGYFD